MEDENELLDNEPQGGLADTDYDYQGEYRKKVKERETAYKTMLDQIELAKQRLENKPTEQTRQEMLRGLAQKLMAPRAPNDPRFFERRNLFTFLRDVGQYGTEQKDQQKKLEEAKQEQRVKLDELLAKTQYAGAQEAEEEAFRAMKEFKPAKAQSLVADAQKILDLQSIIDSPDPNVNQDQREAARVQLSKLKEKIPEADNSRLGQFLKGVEMSRSKDPLTRENGLRFLRMLEGSGRKGGLTLVQQRSDQEILDARNLIKGMPQNQVDDAFRAGPLRNARQNDIVRAWNLARRKTLTEMMESGAVGPSGGDEDVIEEEMPD
jgi:hypothetical protein